MEQEPKMGSKQPLERLDLNEGIRFKLVETLMVAIENKESTNVISWLEEAGEKHLAYIYGLVNTHKWISKAREVAESFLAEEDKTISFNKVFNIGHGGRYLPYVSDFEKQSGLATLWRLFLSLSEAKGPSSHRGVIVAAEALGDSAKAEELRRSVEEMRELERAGKDLPQLAEEEIILNTTEACRQFLIEIKDDPIWEVNEASLLEEIKNSLKEKLGFTGMTDEEVVVKLKENKF